MIHTGRALSVAWSSDGNLIYTGSSDGYAFTEFLKDSVNCGHMSKHNGAFNAFDLYSADILDVGTQNMFKSYIE